MDDEHISIEQAVKEQREIYARLLKEIDDGLVAEAEYLKFYYEGDNDDPSTNSSD